MKVFIFDTETDGLVRNRLINKQKWPRIIDLYGIIVEDGIIVDEIDNLINPGRMVANEKDTTRITGLTNKDLIDKPQFHAIAPRLREMIESCQRVVAHNLAFDKAMVDLEMLRNELRPVRWPQLFCTIENTEHLLGHRQKLIDLHEYLLGEKFENAHRAKTDVMALVRIYHKLVEMGAA